MRLIHYSDKPLGKLKSYKQSGKRDWMKPEGLWVSVQGEDDWVSWCSAASFGLDRFAHATAITLADGAKIITLSSPEDIDRFSKEYAFDLLAAEGVRRPDRPVRFLHSVRWDRLQAEGWQGIIIAPYCWERRMSDHCFWYYGWDCASGCIWDATAIKEVRAIEPPDMTNREEAA